MEVAVGGDRGRVLSVRLAPATYLFAVAHGFGSIDGMPPARLALQRLRSELERRARYDRLRRAQHRPKTVTTALIGSLLRVNADLHARSASHDDYITAGCSLTAVLVIDSHAHLAHAGTTAAYLSRDGYIVSLTKEDAFECDMLPVLTRAMGIESHVEVAVCSFELRDGDALVLSGRHTRSDEDRRRLSAQILLGPDDAGKDDLLIVRYAVDGGATDGWPCHPRPWLVALNATLGTLIFYAALCLR